MGIDDEFIWKNRCEDLDKKSVLFGSEFLNNAEKLGIKPKIINEYEIIYKSGAIHKNTDNLSIFLLVIFSIICLPAHNDMVMNASFVGAIIGSIVWFIVLLFISSYIGNFICNILLRKYRKELGRKKEAIEHRENLTKKKTNSTQRQQDNNPDFDFDPSAFGGGSNNSKSTKEVPYGVDKRHPDDAKLWAIVDDPSSSDQERMTAFSMILKKQKK